MTTKIAPATIATDDTIVAIAASACQSIIIVGPSKRNFHFES
jgi:hypothetical protein